MARRVREKEEDFKEMELWEHLHELRSRIVRSLVYMMMGLVVAWTAYPWLWKIVVGPIEPIMREKGWKFIFPHITGGFMAQFQISLIAGLVLAIPFITLEMWGFIAPGLTRSERKAFYCCVPLSVLFFAFGVVSGYKVMPTAFAYFADFIRVPGGEAVLYQNPIEYIVFVMKMLLAFGLVFQMPVVLMFLAYIGMVTSKMLRDNWRAALVVCAVIAAVATPSPDALTMIMMAAPLGVLYLASIGLVMLVERIREKRDLRPSYDAA